MATMLYCAGYTVYLSLLEPKDAIDFKSFTSIKNALKTAEFRDIVISLASTYGLYFISSILHGEPWHMFTCLLQYTLLIPFYVNILMVYAFCNTHDVSWGTKGDNGGGNGANATIVAGKDGKKLMQVEVPHEREDINANYDSLVKDLRVKVKEVKQRRDAATKKEDYYKLFRTNLVLSWMFSNAFLVVFFTSATWNNYIRDKSNANVSYNPYLTGIFWSVAGLSAFRAFGYSSIPNTSIKFIEESSEFERGGR
ncbi:8061_t:CDS:2 [Entrophospora sp. SA101]|nr:8054_t:CDS:2 [Entrophospora sp. SA101]CAJ0925388.1 8061_t:CDS:2 [Entrophospora sp. SA101]